MGNDVSKELVRRTGVATRAQRQVYYAHDEVRRINRPPGALEVLRPEVEEYLRDTYPEIDNAEVYYCMRMRAFYSVTLDGQPWFLCRNGVPGWEDPRLSMKEPDILDKVAKAVVDCVFWA